MNEVYIIEIDVQRGPISVDPSDGSTACGSDGVVAAFIGGDGRPLPRPVPSVPSDSVDTPDGGRESLPHVEGEPANHNVSRNARDLVVQGRGRRPNSVAEEYYERMISTNRETYQNAERDENYTDMGDLVDALISRFERRMGRFLRRTQPGEYVLAEREHVERKFCRDLRRRSIQQHPRRSRRLIGNRRNGNM
jgi:hypothetical protein